MKQGDVIKFGKVLFKVRELKSKDNNQIQKVKTISDLQNNLENQFLQSLTVLPNVGDMNNNDNNVNLQIIKK